MAVAFALVGAMFGFLARQIWGRPELGDSGAALDALIAERGAIGAIAQPLYTDYVVAFEITGILLLVAIVGALALAKRRVGPEGERP